MKITDYNNIGGYKNDQDVQFYVNLLHSEIVIF